MGHWLQPRTNMSGQRALDWKRADGAPDDHSMSPIRLMFINTFCCAEWNCYKPWHSTACFGGGAHCVCPGMAHGTKELPVPSFRLHIWPNKSPSLTCMIFKTVLQLFKPRLLQKLQFSAWTGTVTVIQIRVDHETGSRWVKRLTTIIPIRTIAFTSLRKGSNWSVAKLQKV